MKKLLLALLCTAILCINLKAQQTPFLQWQKRFGGSDYDRANCIQQTSDGGYIVAGLTGSRNGDMTGAFHGRKDYWILKTDSLGNIQWQRNFGSHRLDEATSIQQTSAGGYIVAGYEQANDGDVPGKHRRYNYWIIKLNPSGKVQWQKTFGGSKEDKSFSIQQTADNGYIVAGHSNSNNGNVTGNHGGFDYWILKLNVNGRTQWEKSYGGSSDDFAKSVKQTADSGYIVAGYSRSNDGDVTGNHGDFDYWIIKLHPNGELQWQKSYGGSADDEAKSIQQTGDDGYIIAGYTRSNNGDVTGNHGGADYWIIKIDGSGNIQWEKTLGGAADDYATNVQQSTDRQFIVAGNSWSKDVVYNHSPDWIVKLNTAGDVLWQKAFGESHDVNVANSIEQTSDGGYIIAGASDSREGTSTNIHFSPTNFWIAKLSPETLSDGVTIFPYHLAKNCAATNAVSCDLTNKNKVYKLCLYRLGKIYDSAINVTAHSGFRNLPAGEYYVTATDENGAISFSKEVALMPIPVNTITTNTTATTARLNWTGFDCAGDYRVQFRMQGDTSWQERQTNGNDTFYTLINLKPATTYVWKVGSRKLKNGIRAKGKFSDSVVFTTAYATTVANQNNITINNNAKIVVLNVSPNPAKNYFIINFKEYGQKINAALYDVNGKAIWTSGLINASALNGKQVNTSQFAKGIFYLKLMNEQGELIGSTKIVVAN